MVRVTLPSEGLSPRSDRHAHAQCGLVGPSRVTARTGLAGRSDRPHTRDRPGIGNHGPPTRASPASMRRDDAPTRFQIGGRSHRRNLPIRPAHPRSRRLARPDTTPGRRCVARWSLALPSPPRPHGATAPTGSSGDSTSAGGPWQLDLRHQAHRHQYARTPASRRAVGVRVRHGRPGVRGRRRARVPCGTRALRSILPGSPSARLRSCRGGSGGQKIT